MTHTPLTKAERDLDAAEAERDALKKSLRLLDRITDGKESSNGTEPEDIQQIVERFVALKAKIYNLKHRICGLDCRYTMGDVADISGSHCTQPCERCLADRDRTEAEAQRDRAESERDAERKMRGEAEAAAKRAEDARDALKAKLAAAESAHSELFLSGQVAELRGKLAALVEACDAKDSLLACYRIGKRPSEALFKKLDKATAAIAAARGGAQ